MQIKSFLIKLKVLNFFVKCDNCGKNFKTTQCLKDHCDQAHQNLPKSHKHKCDQCCFGNTKTTMKRG